MRGRFLEIPPVFDFDAAGTGLPLRIFDGAGHHPYGWLGKGVFFPLMRSEKSSEDSVIRAPGDPNTPVSSTTYSSVGEGPSLRGDRVSPELSRNRQRACLGLIIGWSRFGRHALRFNWRVLGLGDNSLEQ